MDTSDSESDWGFSFDDGTAVSMQDPRAWITANPDSLLKVRRVNLELRDEVEEISDSIGSLLNLRILNIKRGRCLKYLPHALTKLLLLKELSIKNCPVLVQLPSFLGQLYSLESLSVKKCGIKCLPDTLPSLENFSLLTLKDCPNLDQLPCNMGQIANLHSVSLQNCPIESLPGNISVDTLTLKACPVKCFSTKPRKLQNLELDCCVFEPYILASLKDFDHLQTLLIRGCVKESLLVAISELRNLQHLEASECPNIKKLGQLGNLTSLRIVNCPMDILAIEGCVSLVDLTIIDCHMKSIKTTGLTKLGSLRINNCKLLEDLCTDLNSLVRLDNLSLEGCKSLNELPADFDKLTNLSELRLNDTNIRSFPSTINSAFKLPSLKLLSLPMCFRLETLPKDLNFHWIRVYIPLGFRLPANFSATDNRVQVNIDSVQEEMMIPDLFSEQATIETPLNTTNLRQLHPDDGLNVIGETTSYRMLLTPEDRTLVNPDERHRSLGVDSRAYDKWLEGIVNQVVLRDEYSLADPVMREVATARELSNDEITGETTNQQAPSSLGGETLESEGEGDGPLGLIELSEFSANGAEADKCLPSSQDDNNTPSRKGKRAQKTIITEQNRSPIGKKDDRLNVIGETTSYHILLTPEDRTLVDPDERHHSLELTEGVGSHASDKGVENQAMLRDEYSPTDPVMREDAAARELSRETTNQQAPSPLGGETSESEGEGDGLLGVIELSDSSANGAETDKCLPSSQDDNTLSRKGKRAQKTITTEQNRSPMGKKDALRKTKINKEEVLQLIDLKLTRKAAADRLNLSPSTFNQYLRIEGIRWPYRRATKRLQRGFEDISRPYHRATKRLQPDHTAKPILNNFVIKAEYAGDVVKFESSTSTSIDELRDIVGKKFNLDQRAFKLKYSDEADEMILMVDNSDVVAAFDASMEKNEKFVRISVMKNEINI